MQFAGQLVAWRSANGLGISGLAVTNDKADNDVSSRLLLFVLSELSSTSHRVWREEIGVMSTVHTREGELIATDIWRWMKPCFPSNENTLASEEIPKEKDAEGYKGVVIVERYTPVKLSSAVMRVPLLLSLRATCPKLARCASSISGERATSRERSRARRRYKLFSLKLA